MFIHIVFFKLQDRSEANKQHAREKLLTMQGQIPELAHIEVGINVVPQDRAYDIALNTRFASRTAMDAYQVNPLHQAVSGYMRSISQSIVSVDYETE